MMGVYIEGMKIPKEGRITIQIGDDGAVYTVTSCKIAAEAYEKKCPAIEVPEPHGRLIDADVLCNRLEITSRTSYEMREAIEYVAKWIVKYVPTVIPASGRRDEG